MKTLNRSITSQFFVDPDLGYQHIQELWCHLLSTGCELTSAHHLLYAVLRGKDWTKGFSPITNEVKLLNGQQPYQGLCWARDRMISPSTLAIFDGILVSNIAVLLDRVVSRAWLSTEPEGYLDVVLGVS